MSPSPPVLNSRFSREFQFVLSPLFLAWKAVFSIAIYRITAVPKRIFVLHDIEKYGIITMEGKTA